jgi:uncharacterized delta-60 repeat protein
LVVPGSRVSSGADAAWGPSAYGEGEGRVISMRARLLAGIAVSAIALMAGSFAEATISSPGDLDPTFGAGGVVTTSIGQALAMALQPDGKIVLAGLGDSQPGLGWASVVARYLPDGSLDPSFGSGGSVELPRGIFITRIAVGSDGSIVAAASLTPADYSTPRMAVVQLTPSGALDARFGSGGVAQVDYLGNAWGEDVAVQPNGKIVVAGATVGSAHDFLDGAVARLNADGTADTSFGGGKLVVTDFFGLRDYFVSVVLLPDGKIVAGGTAGSEFGLACYSTTGALDLTFGSGGKAVAEFPGGDAWIHDMALQPDGRIVAVGSLGDGASATIPSEDITAARFLADG